MALDARPAKRMWVLSAGFYWQTHLRRHLRSAGWQMTFLPCPWPSAIGVWGRRPASRRGMVMAKWLGPPLVTVEDAMLRSVRAQRSEPSLGLMIDEIGVYFDASKPSAIENLLNSDREFDPEVIDRAACGIAFLRENGLSKYNSVPPHSGDLPPDQFVLVIDQVKGDAAVRYGGASERDFQHMLDAAISENPGKKILVRRHPKQPESGYFAGMKETSQVQFLAADTNVWDILGAASAVYCVTSQLGFEAILAGHVPQVFGKPFYAGWGLTADRQTLERRQRKISAQQLFAAAMIILPVWYDPVVQCRTSFENACIALLARAKHAWQPKQKCVVLGASRWKRKFLRRYLDVVCFEKSTQRALNTALANGIPLAVWASKEPANLAGQAADLAVEILRMEDGFLRSKGLGAELHAPASLVFDKQGIHFNPDQSSDLESLISQSNSLDAAELLRAKNLRKKIVELGISKYNAVYRPMPELPELKRKILVPGQVEGDASVLFGSTSIRTNAALLEQVRRDNRDAFIVYKVHPDVAAGLRKGALPVALQGLADLIVQDVPAAVCIAAVDEVWTMTSQMGFEGLLHGKKVVTFGTPFYTGWGLTTDRGTLCYRRRARPSLDGLVHAALIGYPRYIDPDSGFAATPEQIVRKLSGEPARRTSGLVIVVWVLKLLRKFGFSVR